MKNSESVDRIIQINDVHIGNNIKKYREKAGLKQTELVKKLQLQGIDVSIYTYNRIEKGTQNPTVSFLLAVCRLLSCDINDIFNYDKGFDF